MGYGGVRSCDIQRGIRRRLDMGSEQGNGHRSPFGCYPDSGTPGREIYGFDGEWSKNRVPPLASVPGGDTGGFTLIELLIVIVIVGILASIVVFAVRNLTSSSVHASCGGDFKTVQTAVEDYKAQMGRYPDGGGVTDSDPATPPSLTVGVRPGGTNATAVLLTGSDVNGTGKDSLGNATANDPSPSSSPVDQWLKDVPANPGHYQIYVSNDGKGTTLVLDGTGRVAGPTRGTGGNGTSDCNDLS
jgi:prepilin-type N-terminal cleavage/methylation domain-containing protein